MRAEFVSSCEERTSPSGRWARARTFGAIVLAAKLAWVAPVSADPVNTSPEVSKRADEDAVEAARRVYGKGVEAYEQRRYEEAIELFRHADRLSPNPAFSFNIGTAYQNLGNNEMALRYYRDYLRQAPTASDRLDVLARIRQLESRLLERGVQQVTILTQPANAAVTIDGKPVGLSPWTGELTPGHHEVIVRLSGHHLVQRAFELPAERAIDIPITLLEEPEQTASTVPVAPTRAFESMPEVPWYQDVRPVTWGVLGIGVASFGVALAYELRRANAQDDVSSAGSSEERAGLRETAASHRTWTDAFLLLGLGMTATSGVLIYADVSEARQRRLEPQRGVALGCNPYTCSINYSAAF